jgi:hypothetical protein
MEGNTTNTCDFLFLKLIITVGVVIVPRLPKDLDTLLGGRV